MCVKGLASWGQERDHPQQHLVATTKNKLMTHDPLIFDMFGELKTLGVFSGAGSRKNQPMLVGWESAKQIYTHCVRRVDQMPMQP